MTRSAATSRAAVPGRPAPGTSAWRPADPDEPEPASLEESASIHEPFEPLGNPGASDTMNLRRGHWSESSVARESGGTGRRAGLRILSRKG